ncbi:DNA cytosine methyltransferase [Streptococcus canis]|uniref:DNA cytosine methyltransferase n=1 Tax=Streptococcus canis TaxID=1329 RepID=UPI003B67DAF4
MTKKIIDLFSGVGGLSLGFEQAGFNIEIANEFDKDIAESYIKNHKNTEMIIGDITSLDLEKVFGRFKNQIDVVIGGPPCQGYSQKGSRKSINDERNFLFKYFVKVVELVQPTYFVMENVPNLLTSEKGFFKKELIELFEKIGYSLSMDIIDASTLGVPQRRRRAIIIGKRGSVPLELYLNESDPITIWDAISDLAFLNSGEGAELQSYPIAASTPYQKAMRKNSKSLYNHKATNHSPVALERLAMIPENSGKENLPEEHLTKSIYSGTWERMRRDEQAVTITTRFDTPSSGKFTHPFLNRAITVREAARLQSFPDDFVFYGSKTSQMKQVGNAVPPKLAKAIAELILKDME